MSELGGLYLFVVVFAIVLMICWIILPFAIIGTKPLLRELLAAQKETNRLLRNGTTEPQVRSSDPHAPSPPPPGWPATRGSIAKRT